MPNLFQNPSRVAKIGYNGFDMSCSKKFSSTTGELLPVYYDFLQPGDKLNFSAFLKTRTLPLASAAMVKVTEYLDWFFVPLEHIYHPIRSWFYQVNDNHTSLVNPSLLTDKIPYLSPTAQVDIFENLPDSLLEDAFYYRSSPRLWDMFNIPFRNFEDSSVCVALAPLALYAYQAVYNDYYRLKDREDSHVADYNLDQFYSNPSGVDYNWFAKASVLRYRPRKRDFFTNIFVSPLYDGAGGTQDVGNLDYLSNSFQNWLVSGLLYGQTKPDGTTELAGDGGTSIRPTISVLTDGQFRKFISPSAIRTSFAVEKLLEVTRRAGKTYDAQTLAHFGVKVPLSQTDNVKFVGSQKQDLIIGDVIATADGTATHGGNTSTSVLGQIAGKGYSASQNVKTMNFTAPCHGIFICIYSSEVEPNYSLTYSNDKLNCLVNRSDWYMPEFDNLGMQPLFGYQADLSYFLPSDILGWQYRFSEYKCKFNEVHGAFKGSLSMWVNSFSPYNDQPAFSLQPYLCSPNDLDPVMLVSYQVPNGNTAFASDYNVYDPLLHDIYFDVKKASKMSTYGLPNL